MVFPGKIAKDIRFLFCDVIRRFLGGDRSLISEIEANAESASPIAQLARASLASSQEVSHSAKRQLDKDEALMELEISERKQRLSMLVSEAQMKALDTQMKASEVQMKAADAQMKVMGAQKMLMETYTLLCANQVMDDRARLLFKDNILNIATHSVPSGKAQLTIEDGTVNKNKPITISTLAAELGHRFDNVQLQKIGKKVAAAFREKYGESPPKHEQLVGQASILVNSYTERDRGLLEKVIVDFVNY
jgi:hypothetical protein